MLAAVAVPALVIDGEESPPLLRSGVEAASAALPAGVRQSLPGQGHDISPEATAPVVTEFLLA